MSRCDKCGTLAYLFEESGFFERDAHVELCGFCHETLASLRSAVDNAFMKDVISVIEVGPNEQ